MLNYLLNLKRNETDQAVTGECRVQCILNEASVNMTKHMGDWRIGTQQQWDCLISSLA